MAVALKFGWTGSEAAAFVWIIGRESGHNVNAKNPYSTAYGLGQLLDSTERAIERRHNMVISVGDAYSQALGTAYYIQGRYRTPLGAKKFWVRHRWY